MMKLTTLGLALALLATPLPAQERSHSHPPRSGLGEAMESRGPLATLLRDREALRLTAAQVTQLEAVQQRLIQQNRPLVEQLLQIRRNLGEPPRIRPQEMTPEQRRQWERHVEQARPIMQQIRRHNHQAMEEVRSVLTPEQREQLRQRLEAQRRPPRERAGPHRSFERRGERSDTARGRPR